MTLCPNKVTFMGMGAGLQHSFLGTQFNPQEVASTQLTIVFLSVSMTMEHLTCAWAPSLARSGRTYRDRASASWFSRVRHTLIDICSLSSSTVCLFMLSFSSYISIHIQFTFPTLFSCVSDILAPACTISVVFEGSSQPSVKASFTSSLKPAHNFM